MGNSLQMLFFSSLKDCASLKHFIPSSVKLDHGNQMVPCLVRYGVNASCVCQEGRCLEVVVFIHHVLLNKEAVKSCAVFAACVHQVGSSLKAAASMHHVLLNKKQLKSCGVDASCSSHLGSN